MTDDAASPLRNFRGVVFDLDGTLVDSLDDIANATNAALQDYGFKTHSREAYRHFIGDGVNKLVSRTLPAEHRNDKTIAQCIVALRKHYANQSHSHTKPYDGILELLQALKSRNFTLTVLSNKPHRLTIEVVQRIFGSDIFAVVFGHRDNVPPKPDPIAASEIADTLAIPPSQWLFMGDTAVDMKTAAGAGMCGIGVLWGFRDETELTEAGARHLLSHPTDLLPLLA